MRFSVVWITLSAAMGVAIAYFSFLCRSAVSATMFDEHVAGRHKQMPERLEVAPPRMIQSEGLVRGLHDGVASHGWSDDERRRERELANEPVLAV